MRIMKMQITILITFIVCLYIKVTKQEDCETVCYKGSSVTTIFKIEGIWTRTKPNKYLIKTTDTKGDRFLTGILKIDSTVNGFADGIYDKREGYFKCEFCSRRPIMLGIPRPANGKYIKRCMKKPLRMTRNDNENLRLPIFTVTDGEYTCFDRNKQATTEELITQINSFRIFPKEHRLTRKKRAVLSHEELLKGVQVCQDAASRLVSGASCNEVTNHGFCYDTLGWYCFGNDAHPWCDDTWDNCIDGSITKNCMSQVFAGMTRMQQCMGSAIILATLKMEEGILESLRDINSDIGVNVDGIKALIDTDNEFVKILEENDVAFGLLNASTNGNTLLLKQFIEMQNETNTELWDVLTKIQFEISAMKLVNRIESEKMLAEISQARGQSNYQYLMLKERTAMNEDINKRLHLNHTGNLEEIKKKNENMSRRMIEQKEKLQEREKDFNQKINKTHILIEETDKENDEHHTKLKISHGSMGTDPGHSPLGMTSVASLGIGGFSFIFVLVLLCIIIRCIKKNVD